MAPKPPEAGPSPRKTDPITAEHVALLQGHRDDIQGLRAIAVLIVVLNHAGVGFMEGGYVGVDVFFVLSGFLITGVLLQDVAGTTGGRVLDTTNPAAAFTGGLASRPQRTPLWPLLITLALLLFPLDVAVRRLTMTRSDVARGVRAIRAGLNRRGPPPDSITNS